MQTQNFNELLFENYTLSDLNVPPAQTQRLLDGPPICGIYNPLPLPAAESRKVVTEYIQTYTRTDVGVHTHTETTKNNLESRTFRTRRTLVITVQVKRFIADLLKENDKIARM